MAENFRLKMAEMLFHFCSILEQEWNWQNCHNSLSVRELQSKIAKWKWNKNGTKLFFITRYQSATYRNRSSSIFSYINIFFGKNNGTKMEQKKGVKKC
jgi:Tfp pilus assembly protein PilX